MEKETAEQKKERLNIEESRLKRLQRIKSKQRDRGGIFKPKEHNPLIDILMSRDVSGRSPPKPRVKPRHSSVEKGMSKRGSVTGISTETRDTGRQIPTSAKTSVAGNRRRKTVAPQNKAIGASISTADRSNNVQAKAKPLHGSMIATKRPDEAKSQNHKVSTPTSKRSREATDANIDENIDVADLPSPPKRTKHSSAISSTRKASGSSIAQSKATPKVKSKPRGRSRSVDQDHEDEAPPNITQAVPKKGRSKKGISVRERHENDETSNDVEEPSVSKSETNQTPATKKKNAPKPKPQARKQKKDNAIDDDVEVAKKKGRGGAKAVRTKKKAVPESDPDTEPESQGEIQYRTKFAKPRLETVVEEEHEEEEESTLVSNSKSGAKTAGAIQSDGQKRRRKLGDETEASDIRLDAATSKKARTKAKPASRSRVASTVDEDVTKEEIVVPKGRQKPKSSSASSKAKANSKQKGKSPATTPATYNTLLTNGHPTINDTADPPPNKRTRPNGTSTSKETTLSASKPASALASSNSGSGSAKSKSKPKSLTKSKRAAPTQSQSQRPKFANLPTTLFSSPIKPANNDDDELDFLT